MNIQMVIHKIFRVICMGAKSQKKEISNRKGYIGGDYHDLKKEADKTASGIS